MKRQLTALIVATVMMALPAVLSAGTVGYAVQSNGDGHLYQIDLTTGVATDLGQTNFSDAEGLSFAGSSLYAIGGSVSEFWNITTPPGSKVGDTGARDGIDAGLAYDAASGKMYNIQGQTGLSVLYEIDLLTGAATLVGRDNVFADGLAISSGVAYAIDGIFSDSLYTVDLSTGAMSLVGSLGLGDISVQFGLSFDALSGTLYGLTSYGDIYTFDTATGAGSYLATTISGCEGLAIPGAAPAVPAPGAILLGSFGVSLVSWLRRRKTM